MQHPSIKMNKFLRSQTPFSFAVPRFIAHFAYIDSYANLFPTYFDAFCYLIKLSAEQQDKLRNYLGNFLLQSPLSIDKVSARVIRPTKWYKSIAKEAQFKPILPLLTSVQVLGLPNE